MHTIYFIHKETRASPPLVQEGLNRIFLHTPEMLENPTWHQKQSNIPQLSPPRGRGRWCCPLGTGCSSPSYLSLGDRRVRGAQVTHLGTGDTQQRSQGTVPTWSTIFLPAGGHTANRTAALVLLCPSSVDLQEFYCFLRSLQVYYQCSLKFTGKHQEKIQNKVLCGSTGREFKVLYEQPHFPTFPY